MVCQNIATIILWHQEVGGIIIEMKWMMMWMKIMMQTIIGFITARQKKLIFMSIGQKIIDSTQAGNSSIDAEVGKGKLNDEKRLI